jgi:hypothetical protein
VFCPVSVHPTACNYNQCDKQEVNGFKNKIKNISSDENTFHNTKILTVNLKTEATGSASPEPRDVNLFHTYD